jgi:hypothetical protein
MAITGTQIKILRGMEDGEGGSREGRKRHKYESQKALLELAFVMRRSRNPLFQICVQAHASPSL